MKDLLLRLRALFFRRQMEQDLKEELEFHLEMQARKNQRDAGPGEAQRRARLQFGSVESVTEECREQRGISTLDILARDVRFGLRMLRKSPSFTAVAILTLTLAIGANALVFAVMNALILRPLDLPRAESLYQVEHAIDMNGQLSYPAYVDFRDRNRSFEELAAYSIAQAGIESDGEPTSAWVSVSTENYFDVLGIEPFLGRFFHRSDERGPNTVPYIVLSHAYWHSRFGDDPSVIGRVVQVNKHPFTIIGVAPAGFKGPLLPFAPDFFLPIVNQSQIYGTDLLNVRSNKWVFATLGHLKPGVTPEQASADLNAIGADLEKAYPKDHAKMRFTVARPGLYGDFLGRPLRGFFMVLMLLSGLILLAACANLGSLFAARAAERSREVALRLAIGASRGRILRQLFTEAMLISLAGGVAGLWASLVLLRALRLWQPFPQFPIVIPVTPDASVYAIAFLLTVASGFLFGAVPVKQVFHTDPYEIVKGAKATTRQHVSLRDVLVVAQIAICAVLLTSSLVAVRGMARTLRSNFGFQPANVMLMSTGLDMGGYTLENILPMQKRMVEGMQSIPGVTSVGLIDQPPLYNGGARTTMVFKDETAELTAANAVTSPAIYNISPDYIHAAGVVLRSGRDFTWHDDASMPSVALVNEEFARRIFGGAANALGRHFKMRDGKRVAVVGIVENGKYVNLTENQRSAMFVPMQQAPTIDTWVIARSESDPQQLAVAMKNELRRLDAGVPAMLQTWNDALGLTLFPARVATVALGTLGTLGAILSLSGIFGMAAYSVTKRRKELGIRIALGAESREVLQAALGRALKVLTLGSVIGIALGILASRLLAFVVYQATTRDPLVLGGVVVAMLLLGLLATWIPARRALSIDPLILLRED